MSCKSCRYNGECGIENVDEVVGCRDHSTHPIGIIIAFILCLGVIIMGVMYSRPGNPKEKTAFVYGVTTALSCVLVRRAVD